MSQLLIVKELKKVYGKKKPFLAVDGISFELRQGEILGLLGPNGSGKTTTIQMLLGTLSYTGGSIHYFGKDFTKHRSEVLQHIAYASSYTSLPWLLTIEENLQVFGSLYGFNAAESARRADPLLERFGILNKKKSRVSSLSAGQITRLMLVKAFFIQPKIALLDEPTASLDPEMSKEVCEFLLEQREKWGLSILFTSHKMDEATQLCDRVIFLKQGKIIADDVPKKLARSLSTFRLRLTLIDGLERAVTLAVERGFAHRINHHTIEIHLDEKELPLFIQALGPEGITYSNIQIEEPSLEDYFLQIAGKVK